MQLTLADLACLIASSLRTLPHSGRIGRMNSIVPYYRRARKIPHAGPTHTHITCVRGTKGSIRPIRPVRPATEFWGGFGFERLRYFRLLPTGRARAFSKLPTSESNPEVGGTIFVVVITPTATIRRAIRVAAGCEVADALILDLKT